MIPKGRWAAVLLVVAVACGEDEPGPDASIQPPVADSGPDAFNLCPGQLTFTGDFVDWDSTPTTFKGVFDATLTELGNTSNTAHTAPNGRGVLCVASGTDTVVEFTHSDYVTMRYSADADVVPRGPFSMHGLTPARLTQLFAEELKLTPDGGDALVIVELRQYPAGDPVIGATVVAASGAADGAFTPGTDGTYAAGNQTADDAYVLFANTPISSGKVSISVTPPNGVTCTGRNEIEAVAGQVAATTFSCQ
jgi:hypothetical protein